MTQRPKLRIFLDECVPDGVWRIFSDCGHYVIYLREAGATGSPDPLVCTLAEENDAILVSLDGDMKQIAKGQGVSNKRFAMMSLIKFSCESAKAAARAADSMSIIEHEWERSKNTGTRRVFVEIYAAAISIKR